VKERNENERNQRKWHEKRNGVNSENNGASENGNGVTGVSEKCGGIGVIARQQQHQRVKISWQAAEIVIEAMAKVAMIMANGMACGGVMAKMAWQQ
jgi:hypothetical protein